MFILSGFLMGQGKFQLESAKKLFIEGNGQLNQLQKILQSSKFVPITSAKWKNLLAYFFNSIYDKPHLETSKSMSFFFPSQVRAFVNFQQFKDVDAAYKVQIKAWVGDIGTTPLNQEEKLIEELFNSGERNWKVISKKVNQRFPQRKRNAKQCRERYSNFIKFEGDPNKGEGWKIEEEIQLLNQYMAHGSKWTQISEKIPGKSPNVVKNKFYGSIRRLIRKLNDAMKKSQIKSYRKQISYQSIFRLLSINTSHPLQTQNSQAKSQEKQQFIWNLKYDLLKLATELEKTVQYQQALEFCQKICQFNIMTRAQRLKQLKNAKNPNKNHRKFLPPLYSKNEYSDQNIMEQNVCQDCLEEGSEILKREHPTDELEQYQGNNEFQNKYLDLQMDISQMLNLMGTQGKTKFLNFYD